MISAAVREFNRRVCKPMSPSPMSEEKELAARVVMTMIEWYVQRESGEFIEDEEKARKEAWDAAGAMVRYRRREEG